MSTQQQQAYKLVFHVINELVDDLDNKPGIDPALKKAWHGMLKCIEVSMQIEQIKSELKS